MDGMQSQISIAASEPSQPMQFSNKLVRHGAALHGDSGVSRATQLMV